MTALRVLMLLLSLGALCYNACYTLWAWQQKRKSDGWAGILLSALGMGMLCAMVLL